MKKNVSGILGLVAMVGILVAGGQAQAGKITTFNNATGTEGFGGWNLENVEVETFKEDGSPTATAFDEATGAYDAEYFSFDSNISGATNSAPTTPVVMGVLHGKDYPVGEPAGIKVIHDDAGVKAPKPQNCIMTTSYLDTGYLDTPPIMPTTCSSPFQTHKRYKVNMQPSSLDTDSDIATYEGAVDLVFNVEPESGSTRDYQMFQKMNNYTGSRLEGFAIQVGTGTSTAFETAGDSEILTKLSIWASLTTVDADNGIWDPDQLATFSHGLFGPIDNHFPEEGFFDNRIAGFMVDSPAQGAGLSDTLSSGLVMESNYNVLPVPGATSPVVSQFGPWLHSGIAPSGIFYDDDNDPSTDAELVAFWGDIDGSGTTFAWMRGNSDNFALVDPLTLSAWDADPLYAVDVIEDTLNLSLNYVVTVGTVDASWPTWDGDSATFTIRMIPLKDTSGTDDPAYAANPPSGIIPEAGTVQISPAPNFMVGSDLTISVADGNAASVTVVVENLTNGDTENAVAMSEVSAGYFSGTLATSTNASDSGTNGVLYVQPGDEVKVTYVDDTPANTVTDNTTAIAASSFFVIPVPGGGAAVIDL